MKIFDTNAAWCETPRWNARPSASQFSETFRKRLRVLAVSFLIAFALGGCGYADTPPPPNFTVSLQPTSVIVALGQTQQFQATVTGPGDIAVIWEVNGVANGNSISGTVTDSGLYTAPMAMPSPASVTVTVISQVNPNDHASASVTLQDGIAIIVSPGTATVAPGGAQVFTASISGAGGVAGGVTWSANGAPGGNATVGTIVVNGASSAVYTAPAVIPSPALVTVMAASVADPAKTGSDGDDCMRQSQFDRADHSSGGAGAGADVHGNFLRDRRGGDCLGRTRNFGRQRRSGRHRGDQCDNCFVHCPG